MESVTQIAQRRKEQEQRKLGGRSGPYQGVIQGVSPINERVTVDFYGGTKGGAGIKVPHPFLGMTSWYRAMPDQGTGVLLFNRSDTQDAEIARYFLPNTKQRIESYAKALEAYRPLQPGAQEISSSGLSQIFFAQRPIMDTRAGVVRSWHDQDKTEFGVRSPIHRRVGYQNASDIIADEERWGVVKRPTSPIRESYTKIDDKFAKEHLDVMLFEGTPNILYDKREGHVVDNDGNQVSSDVTGNPLRLRHIFYTTEDTAYVREIDELGNETIVLPNEAEEGMMLVIPKGNLKHQIEKDYIRTIINGNEQVSIGKDHILLCEGKETIQIDQDVKHKYAGNMLLEVSSTSIKITDTAGNKIELTNSALNIEGVANVNVKGTNVKVEGTQVQITGGVLTVNGTAAPTGPGPFCALPVCVLTGATHTGPKVLGT